MITIKKSKIVIICLAVVAMIILLIIEILQFFQSDDKKGIQIFNTAKLQSTNTTEENEVEDTENTLIEKQEEIMIVNDSEEIIELNNNNWNYQESNFKGEYVVDGNYYHYQGFTIIRDKNYIPTIIFNKDYDGAIVSGIYVGMDFDEIEEILGKPMFENDDGSMIGYATKNLYICIYSNEIAVYQNRFYGNRDLETMILKYYNNEYNGTANEFSRYIRNNYEDFAFSSDEERNIYLTSIVRGMVIKLDDNVDVKLYKEYDSSKILENNFSDNIEIVDEYMVEVLENERISEQ